MDKELVKERIQSDFNAIQLLKDLKQLTEDTFRSQLLKDYAELRSRLGGPGASIRAAQVIVDGLKRRKN